MLSCGVTKLSLNICLFKFLLHSWICRSSESEVQKHVLLSDVCLSQKVIYVLGCPTDYTAFCKSLQTRICGAIRVRLTMKDAEGKASGTGFVHSMLDVLNNRRRSSFNLDLPSHCILHCYCCCPDLHHQKRVLWQLLLIQSVAPAPRITYHNTIVKS